MSTHSTTAVVLRLVEFSETSFVVTLLTRDRGRVSALAKGARRLKSPFEGSLDLLSVCRIVLIAKPGDSLDLLTESKLRRRFRGAERSIERCYAGFYVAEMLRLLVDDDDPHEDLFELTLAVLGQIDGDGPVAETLLAFDCQALRILGHAPSLFACTHCGTPVPRNRGKTAFSLPGGGVVCSQCRPRQTALLAVSSESLDALDALLRPPTARPVLSDRQTTNASTAKAPATDGPTVKNEPSEAGHLEVREPQIAAFTQPGTASRGTITEETLFPIHDQLFDLRPKIAAELRTLINRYFQCLLGRVPRMQNHLSHVT